MEAFISLIRHYVTYWVTKLVLVLGLPEELKTQTIEHITEAVAILVSWAIVKYLLPLLKGKIDSKSVALLFLCFGSLFFMTSCRGLQVEGEFRGPISQIKYENGKAVIDQKTKTSWLNKGVRILLGEKPKDVILPTFPTINIEK